MDIDNIIDRLDGINNHPADWALPSDFMATDTYHEYTGPTATIGAYPQDNIVGDDTSMNDGFDIINEDEDDDDINDINENANNCSENLPEKFKQKCRIAGAMLDEADNIFYYTDPAVSLTGDNTISASHPDIFVTGRRALHTNDKNGVGNLDRPHRSRSCRHTHRPNKRNYDM